MEEEQFNQTRVRLQELNKRLQKLIELFEIPYENSEVNPTRIEVLD